MERFRASGGQATGEYVALVALLAATFVLAAGLTSGGVGARVLAGLQRGLCAVAGRACPRPTPVQADLPPCPLQRSSRVELLSEVLGVVKLGAGGTLSAERGSDGRVTVTLANDTIAGEEVGAGLRLRLGSSTFGGSARAGLLASWTSGRSWTLPSAAAAHDFVARYGAKATVGGQLVDEVRSRCSLLCDAIGWRPHPQLPPPDATYEEGGALATLTGSLGLDAPATAGGELRSAAVLGRRVARDGTATWYLRLTSAATASLGLEPAELSGELGATSVVSYTLDPAGRPATLAIELAGEAGAGASLGGAVPVDARTAASAGSAIRGPRASAGVGAARAIELDARLDLHEPANRTAATALLATLVRPAQAGELPQRAAALQARIAQTGELDRRTYALQRSATGVGATVGLAVELSGGFDRTREGMRLLDAETRLPGLPFLPRDDCRRAAG